MSESLSADAPAPTWSEEDRKLTRRVLRQQNQGEVDDPAMLVLDLLNAGRLADATLVFESASDADLDDPDLLFVGASVARANHDPITARALLVTAARKAPLWVAPLVGLAELLADAGDWARAWSTLERCESIDPANEAARELRDQLGPACRLDSRRRAFLESPDQDDGAMLANALVAAGRTDEALDVLERALEHDPEDADVLFVQGNLLNLRGETARARQSFRRVTQVDAGWAEAWEAIADVIDEEGDIAGAERLRAHAATIEVDPLMLIDLSVAAGQDDALEADISLALDVDRAIAEGLLAVDDRPATRDTIDLQVDLELDALLDEVERQPLRVSGLRASRRGRPYVPPTPAQVYPRSAGREGTIEFRLHRA